MKKLYAFCTMSLFVLIASCSLISCSSDEESRSEVAKIVEGRSTQDLLNDLYLSSDGNIASLARMLQVTPSSIDRIREGETEATPDFEEKIKSVATYYYQNGRKFSRLQSILDPESSWYNSVLRFPSHHPISFWTINIILFLLLAFVAIIVIWPMLIELLIFFVAWLASMFCSPNSTFENDQYTDSINPVVEQVI